MLRSLLISLLLYLSFCQLTNAKMPPPEEISIEVFPGTLFPGDSVRITGYARPVDQGGIQVTLDFQGPKGEKLTERLQTDAKGEFTFAFTQAKTIGIWKVIASKAGNSGTANRNFQVITTQYFSPFSKELKGLTDLGEPALKRLESDLKAYPDFQGKSEMEAELQKLIEELRQLISRLLEMEQAGKKMESAINQHFRSLDERTQNELTQTAASFRQSAEAIKEEMAMAQTAWETSQQTLEWCQKWNQYATVLNKLGTCLNYAKISLTSWAETYAKNWLQKDLPYSLKTSLGAFDYVLNTAAGGFTGIEFVKFLAGNILSYEEKKLNDLINQYCTEFLGTLTGDYQAELREEGQPFMIMRYRLDAKVRLMFQQRKPGDPRVYVEGEIKGMAKAFSCDMDMDPFEIPLTQSIAWCRYIPRKSPGLTGPSFSIPVKGYADDDKFILQIDDSRPRTDFEWDAVGTYVLLGATLAPEWDELKFPYMDAYWFITRATHYLSPSVEYLELPFREKNGVPSAEAEWDRDLNLPETQQRQETNVKMHLEVDVQFQKRK